MAGSKRRPRRQARAVKTAGANQRAIENGTARRTPQRFELEADTYPYTDPDGAPLYRVRRRSGKQFHQEAWDGDGWVLGRKATPDVPYRLPELLDAVGRGATVYVVEGEKDVEAARAQGAVATCNPGGAGKWGDALSECLAGAKVIVVCDRDEPGRKHALQVAASLRRVGARVRFARAREGNDLADHLAAGHTLDDLVFRRPKAPKPNRVAQSRRDTNGVLPAMYQLVVLKLRGHADRVGRGQPQKHDHREGFEAICPAHDDRRRSLGVALGDYVPVLLSCRAGCDTRSVVEALGIDWRDFNAAADSYRRKSAG